MLQFLKRLLQKKAIKELIKYGIVGIIGLVIDMGIYYLLVKRYEVHYPFTASFGKLLNIDTPIRMIDILTSNVISQTLAIINNFILNSYFTFKITNNKFRRFLSFAGVASIGIVISSALLTIFIEGFGMSEMIAKAVSVLIVAMLQFIINKYVTFRQKDNKGIEQI